MKKLICFLLLLPFTSRISAQWTEQCGTGNGFIVNFETFNNELYATGFFTNVCGISANHIAKLGTNGWEAVGTGLPQAGHQLQAIGNELYAVHYEPNIDSNWLYRFDGTNFNKIGAGFYLTNAVAGFSKTANLYRIHSYGGEVVVSGEFDRVGSEAISGIASWNGSEWNPLGTGLSGTIPGTADVMYPHDLCTFGTDLIAAGNFQFAGGETVNGIARWDGTQWHAMGAGFNSTVYGTTVYNGELYAGGDFTSSGTETLKNIAKWNGTAWVDPGFRVFYNNSSNYSYVHTLKVINDQLLISGGFDRVQTAAQTMRCSAVIAYNGTLIDTLSGGIPGKEIEALARWNGRLYAGGGLNGSSYIARYEPFLSVDENEQQPVTISPNPTSGVFKAELTLPGTALIVICDPSGKEVLRTKDTLIDLSAFGNGYYSVQIITDEGVTREKILLQR